MAATHVIGRRSYATQSGRIIPNVLPRIILIDRDPSAAAFLAFYSRVRTRSTSQEQFTWDVDEYLAITDTLDGAVSSTTQETLQVDNPKYFIPGQLWTNKRTGEVVFIKSVNTSTSQITVTRAVTALNSSGGTAAATMNDADTLVRLAPAVGENSTRQTTQTTTPTEVSNYCQQFRWELGLSRRQIKREFETEDELPYQRFKIMNEARMALNRQFLVGEKARYTDDDGEDVTLTSGIKPVISTYTWSVGGTLHEYEWDEFLVEEGLRRGSRNKVLFASTNVILALSQMTKDRVEYSVNFGTGPRQVGITVMEYMAPNGGRIMVVEDRFLSEAFNGIAIGVDMSELERRVFSRNGYNDDLHIMMGTQDNDDLGNTDTLYADIGLQYGAEQHHFLITNVEGGAKGKALS